MSINPPLLPYPRPPVAAEGGTAANPTGISYRRTVEYPSETRLNSMAPCCTVKLAILQLLSRIYIFQNSPRWIPTHLSDNKSRHQVITRASVVTYIFRHMPSHRNVVETRLLRTYLSVSTTVLKISMEPGSDTFTLSAKLQNDWTTEMNVVDEGVFTRFENLCFEGYPTPSHYPWDIVCPI